MKWTTYKASLEWNVDQKTLKKGLVENGLPIRRGATYTTLEICGAIYGDLDRERTLETRERRKALEKDNAVRNEELVSMVAVTQMFNEALGAVRSVLLAMPSECCAMANPSDPVHSRSALQNWLDTRCLPLIRQRLPQPPKSKPRK